MREILFRGKCTANGEWVYGDLLNVGVDYDYAIRTYGGREHGQVNAVNEKTVGQYTGLTDKNGKKIFEGDILDCGDRVVYVKWHEICGTWDCDFVRYKGVRCSNGITPVEWKYRAEIIGNIHDNPELLKGGE
jgi:uncharacterized phage protein (TIGR01671 family)